METLEKRAKELLSTKSPKNKAEIDALVRDLQLALSSRPESGVVLGPLIGSLRKLLTTVDDSELRWVPVAGGHLALGHRPKSKTFALMPSLGVTHVLTLLSVREGAEQIGRKVQEANLNWIWLPLESGNPPEESRSSEVREVLDLVVAALRVGGRVLLHCSAGIHRTGMIANAVIRHAGLSKMDARAKLLQLRTETAEGVGEHRLAWGDHQFAGES